MRKLAAGLFIVIVALGLVLMLPNSFLSRERHALAAAALDAGLAPLAASLLRPLAATGDATALNNLGVLHVRGNGMTKDRDTALRLLENAAERGSVRGRLNLVVLRHGGCGLHVRNAAQAAVELQALVDAGDATAASLVHECLYFSESERTVPDRNDRFLAAGDVLLRSRDPGVLLQSGWGLLNLARTTKIPDWGNEAEQAQYERKVVPIAQKAMQVLFAAADAGATGAYEAIGVLSMQFGELLGDDPLAVRVRERSFQDWIEEGAARGDWNSRCRVTHQNLQRWRQSGPDVSPEMFEAAKAQMGKCNERKEAAPRQNWHDEPEWLVYVPRRMDGR